MKQIDEIIIKRVLNNRGTKEEAETVAQWLSTPEGQRWLAKAIEYDAALIDKGVIEAIKDLPSDEILERILSSVRKRQFRRIALSFAAALIPLLVIATLWLGLDSRIGGALTTASGEETIATRRGQQKEVIFQDGSSVILNGESSLTFPRRFGIAKRMVSLEGEALFKVSQNKRRPFIVSLSDNSSVKVLGTTFNINSYDDNPTIDITLMSGLVEFNNEEKIYSIKPDECLSYNKTTGDVSISKLKNSNISSLWTENILVFNDTPLERVLHTLSRYYDVNFEIADTAANRCSYTLKTQKGANIDEVLDDIASISPVKFVKRNDIITVHLAK